MSRNRKINIIPQLEKKQAILTYTPYRPPPLLNFGTHPEINFFDVSDDLEQKKKNFFLVQKNVWT